MFCEVPVVAILSWPHSCTPTTNFILQRALALALQVTSFKKDNLAKVLRVCFLHTYLYMNVVCVHVYVYVQCTLVPGTRYPGVGVGVHTHTRVLLYTVVPGTVPTKKTK